MKILFPILFGFISALVAVKGHEFSYADDPFRQLGTTLPAPSEARLASGAPGPAYWQQRADYHIKVTLDDDRQHLTGSEVITYHNHSPHTLSYLWLQLDQNRFKPDSGEMLTKEAPGLSGTSFHNLRSQLSRRSFDGGYKITRVAGKGGKELPHAIIGTMMRIDLPQALQPGKRVELHIDWSHNIIDADLNRARGGHEYFKKDKNYIYEIAQWYPRMVAYTDYTGWQNKQFLGRGEFTLEFGDYRVEITVPADHIVAAAGELQNSNEILTEQQRKRLEEGKISGQLSFIVTPEEAKAAQDAKNKPKDKKTWVFSAKNVRDFAWASSRKFIWDAKYHEFSPGKHAWAMSFYPNEAEPLWSKYSTAAVAHTLDVFSKFTFDYPYPVAISVNGPVGGMEYPMICFNGPRPEEDGTYSEGTKHGLIGVVIHEVGHNWFPMIVNSDERQWTWMDEGLNTFVEFLAEMEWQEKWPWARGKPKGITGYMAGSHQRPIMTNSEAIHQFGNNAYAKPAAALNVLRETVMGREVFDFAFKEYSRRWMFKRPEPADFFRSMEDASGIDLDWFWRGWFYTTKHVDVSLKALRMYEIDTRDPDIEKPLQKEKRDELDGKDLTDLRNAALPKATDRDRNLLDFYNKFDKLDVTEKDRTDYRKFLESLDDDDKKLLALRRKFYVIELENIGGLVTPLVIAITYAGGKTETVRIPAEIWRRNTTSVRKMIIARKEITGIEFDPMQETADANRDNNYWPPRAIKSRFQLHKGKKGSNPMRDAQNEVKRLKKEKEQEQKKQAGKDKDAKKQ